MKWKNWQRELKAQRQALMKLSIYRNSVLASLFGLASFTALAQDASAEFDEFCSTYRAVHATAFRGFKPWRGAAEEQYPESFATTIKFPGAESCDINDDEFGHQFTCYWKYAYDQDGQSIGDAVNLTQSIRRCMNHPQLANPRAYEPRSLGEGAVYLWGDRFEGSTDHVETSVYVIKRPSRKSGKTREIAGHISLGLQIGVDKY
jgi:hypothetical protein